MKITDSALPPAICLMGPTASGKTNLAIRLARDFNCDIISVDSALVYRGMDIGTAKPNAEELAQAPHRLIDICDPSEAYSAASFREDALRHMAEITAAGRVPLLVGGTMLYYKALIDGISPLPAADAAVRAEIDAQAKSIGWQALHDELQRIDPVAAQRIHPNDPQRLGRALEVFRITGKTLTELTQQQSPAPQYNFIQTAIAPASREILHQRIEQRFQQMLELGFQQEVEALYQRDDLHPGLPSIRCVGYRQMWSYLSGEYDHDEMVYRGVVATRQLAKRQMTWLRSWSELSWLDSLDLSDLDQWVASLRQAGVITPKQ